MRVGVLVLLDAEQVARAPQRLDDVGAGLVHAPPGELAEDLVEGAVRPDAVVHGQAVVLGELEVVLAEGDAGVHHARAVLHAHELRRQDRAPALAPVGDVVEGRLVAQALELGALDGVRGLDPLPEQALHELLGHDHRLVADPGAHVGLVRVDRERRVREQGPRLRRPRQEGDALLALEGEAHVDARVDDVLVASASSWLESGVPSRGQ